MPLEGNPLSATLPVLTLQVGCVIVPTVGAEGNEFTVAIISVLETEVHPLLDAST